jgi:uncharacterized membrane protein YjgN (DUF898 family)
MAQRSVILTGFCSFTQSLQSNAGQVLQITPQLCPSTSFSYHYLLIILLFIVLQSWQWKVRVNKIKGVAMMFVIEDMGQKG